MLLHPEQALVAAVHRSSRIGGVDALGYLGAVVALRHRDIVLALQIEPELRAVAEISVRTPRARRHRPTSIRAALDI